MESRTRTRKCVVLATVVVLTAAAGVGIWLATRSAAKYSGPVEKVRLGLYPGEVSGLVFIAEAEKYFEDYGLEVSIQKYEAGALALEGLKAGEVDIATTAEYPFMLSSVTDADLRILGVINQADTTYLVARKDRGISQPGDLRGKRIGLTLKSQAEFYLGKFLALNGVSLGEVEVVDLKPSQMESAISTGAVDAVIGFDPVAYSLTKSRSRVASSRQAGSFGANATVWSAQGGQDFFWLLVSTQPYLSAHPQVGRRLMGAMVESEEFVNKSERQAKKIIGKYAGVDTEYINYIWPKLQYSASLGQPLLVALEDQARWAIGSGLIGASAVPNYLRFIDFQPLEQVKPNGVTIVH